MKEKKLRNDIQFLRALSVIVVILFHLGFLKNGFLGVDVFFVISGFLITSNINKEIDLGQFSVREFYKKRIRRLLPSLLFVYAIVLAIGLVIYLPDDLENLAQSVIASFFSLNNYLLLNSSGDYWSLANDYKPLMHTWSLGIEEQFYLFYPFYLIFIQKFKNKLKPRVLVITLLTFVFVFFIEKSDVYRFYGIENRIFEFLFGALIVFIPKENTRGFTRWISSIALFFICVMLLSIKDVDNIWLLCLIILVSVFIYFDGSTTMLNYIVNNRLVIIIGAMSYSIYLWHQPLLAFMRYMFAEFYLVHYIGYILALTLLSWLSYSCIEIPFRSASRTPCRKFGLVFIPIIISVLGLSVYLVGVNGCYKKFDNLRMSKISFSFDNIFNRDLSPHKFQNERVKYIDFSTVDSLSFNVLIIGDSYGRDLFNIINNMCLSNRMKILYFDYYTTDSSKISALYEKSDMRIFCIKAPFYKENLRLFINRFGLDDRKKFVVFGPKYYGPSMGPVFIKRNFVNTHGIIWMNPDPSFLSLDKKMEIEWNGLYVSMLKETLNDDGKLLCLNEKGELYSYDGSHLTAAGIEFFSRELVDNLNEIIKLNGSN